MATAGRIIGRLSIKVLPDLTDFKTDLASEIKQIEDSTKVNLKASLDATSLKDEITRETTGSKGTIQFDSALDSTGLLDDITKVATGSKGTVTFGARINRAALREALREAGRSSVTVKVEPDFTRFQQRLQAGLESIAKRRAVVKIPVDLDLKDIQKQLRYIQRIIKQTFQLVIPVRLDIAPAIKDLIGLRILAERGLDVPIRTDRNVFAMVARSILKATLAMTAFGVATAAATSALSSTAFAAVALVNALAPLAGLVVGVPATILAAASAFAALKVGLSGMGAALSSLGDAEAFNEALKKLSPNAREFAIALREVAPAYREMQQAVQDKLFVNLRKEIGPLATSVLPTLHGILLGLAGSFGTAATYTARWVRSAQGLLILRGISNGLQHTFTQLAPAMKPITEAFLRIGEVGASQLPAIGTLISGLATRFATFIAEAQKTGQLQQFFAAALATLGQLGAILGNVGGILQDVFSAQAAVGAGGLLATITQITDAIKGFTSSLEGQQALQSFFQTLSNLGSFIGPVFGELVSIIGTTVLPIFKTLTEAIGPALLPVIQALGEGLKALAPAAGPVGTAVAAILSAVRPLLPLIGQLAGTVLTLFATNLETIAKAVGPLIAALSGGLIDILKTLQPAFLQVALAIRPMVGLLGSVLTGAINKILPSLLKLAEVFAGALVDSLPKLTQAFDAIIPVLIQFADIFANAIINAIEGIIPVLPDLITGFVDLLTAFSSMIVQMAPISGFLVNLILQLVRLVPIVAGFGVALLYLAQVPFRILEAAAVVIREVIGALGRAIMAVPGALAAAGGLIVTIWNFIVAVFTNQVNFIKAVISTGWNFIVAVVRNQVGFIRSIITTVFGAIRGYIASVVNIWRSTISLAWNAIVSLVTGAVNRIRSVINGISAIIGVIRDAFNRAKDAAGTALNGLLTLVSGLPGRAVSAMGSLGGRLYGAGRDLIQGMINGVRDMAGNIADAAGGVVDGAIAEAKSRLGIKSPSRVFAEIGRNVGAGLAQGMDGTHAVVERAASRMAAGTIAAFNLPASELGYGVAGGNTYNIALNAAPSVPTERQLLSVLANAEQMAALNY